MEEFVTGSFTEEEELGSQGSVSDGASEKRAILVHV